jgi:hypothetical protein
LYQACGGSIPPEVPAIQSLSKLTYNGHPKLSWSFMYCHDYVLKRKIGSGSWTEITISDRNDTDYIDSSIDLNTIQYKIYYQIYGKIYDELSWGAPQVVYDPPAVSVEISGPLSLESGVAGEFTANTTGGELPFSYEWYRYQICPDDPLDSDGTEGIECGFWKKLPYTTSTISTAGYAPGFQVKVVVTTQSSSDMDTHYVDVD